MSKLTEKSAGRQLLVMGNEAIVRGALEAGVSIVAGYPGTPSSEIIERLADVAEECNLYVEWSTNEKVAAEVAAAGSFAGLRSMCTMKQNGVNVASDFLIHLAISGTRAGYVAMVCDDPGSLSSNNEAESAFLIKQIEMPLIEPGDFQEAKDMTRWAFDLSEEVKMPVMMRSVTRLSHASGNVVTGELPDNINKKAAFECNNANFLDPESGAMISAVLNITHPLLLGKLKQAQAIFEESPFNTYSGPEKPELMIITRGAASLYCKEAINELGVEERVGLFKIGTTWPLPPQLVKKHLKNADKVLFVEEVKPFLEENVKILAAETAAEIGIKTFYGKNDESIPAYGELNPDLVIAALTKILGIEDYVPMTAEYQKKALMNAFFNSPPRDMTFCPGCPHRASFFCIHNVLKLDDRQAFVCGDIGCYAMAVQSCGFESLKTLHAMGSGSGLASGFGKLGQFGFDQPVLAVCGDSTFFHSVLPPLVNAVHNQSDMTLVVLDNGGTAMTGFQPHPGLPFNLLNDKAPQVSIPAVAEAIGATVRISDPFDIEGTQAVLEELINLPGVKVLVMRQMCALSPEKKNKKKYVMSVDETLCKGDSCGCNCMCTRIWGCPGIVWDKENHRARIDEVLCTGCGVCADICPQGAIKREEA